MNACAVNVSFRNSFLDHITPLASLLNLPLLVNDEINAEFTKRYYPEVDLRTIPDIEYRTKELAEEFDIFFGCDYWGSGQKAAFRLHTQKQMQLIFCPHGQSDKGYNSSFLFPYAKQETVLLYGNLLKEMLIDLQLWDKIPRSFVVGNFRKLYYQKHRERLSCLAEVEIFSRLNGKNPTLLYAPTWNDPEQSGTFFSFGTRLLEDLPSSWNLLIKVHPDLAQHDPVLYYRLSLFEKKQPNFLLVENFPPIYPLLERIDAYLGDYSSIGYDVLAFQKPMFFLQKPHLAKARLHACGTVLDPSENLFASIEKGLANASLFQEAQKELYQRAFAPVEDVGLALQPLFSGKFL